MFVYEKLYMKKISGYLWATERQKGKETWALDTVSTTGTS